MKHLILTSLLFSTGAAGISACQDWFAITSCKLALGAQEPWH